MPVALLTVARSAQPAPSAPISNVHDQHQSVANEDLQSRQFVSRSFGWSDDTDRHRCTKRGRRFLLDSMTGDPYGAARDTTIPLR